MKPGAVMGTVVAAGIALAALSGCSSAGNDKYGCSAIQDDLNAVYKLADRLQYGNAPTSDMLDALQELKDTADGQLAAAKTSTLKGVAGDVRDATATMYLAVNSNYGQESAATNLVAAGKKLNTACAELAS